MKAITKGFNGLVIAAIIIATILFSGLAKGWRTFGFAPGDGPDTHEYMSRRAIELVIPESNYPDVHKFKEAIIEGSSKTKNDSPVDYNVWGIITSGLIHHYPPGHEAENAQYNYTKLCEEKWKGVKYGNNNAGILDKYNKKDYRGDMSAYWLIGNIAHLVQDMSAPPHAYKAHGTSTHPGDPLLPWPPGDQIEYFASQIVGLIPSLGQTATYDSAIEVWGYPDKTGTAIRNYCEATQPYCGKYYDYEEGAAIGSYGVDGVDDFPAKPEDGEPGHTEAVKGLLGIGIEHTAGMLMSASKRLPPLITKIDGDQHVPCGSLRIEVHENRVKGITYSIWVNDEIKITDKPKDLDSNDNQNELPWKGEIEEKYSSLGISSKGSYEIRVEVKDGEDGNTVSERKNIKVEECDGGGGTCPSTSEHCETGQSTYCASDSSWGDCDGPGGEPRPPDENLIISDWYDLDVPTYDPEALVGILTSGYYPHAIALMGKMNIPITLIQPDYDFYPGLAQDVPVLIIPSSGFTNYIYSYSFEQTLNDYINNGGSIIVFSQPSQEEFSLLPGYLDAYGYTQDMSCYRRGARLKITHPILSSEETAYSDVHMDGFFVNYPPDTEELLIREANGQPAVIVYPYGEGTVIATDMYPDYAYWTGQYSADELHYVRDMITWALHPTTLREYQPGDSDSDFTFTLELPADVPSEAVLANVMVLDPDRSQILVDDHLPVYLAPGDLVQVSLALPELPYKLGIWHVAYELVDADGNTIHEERECLDGRFVVADWHLSTISIPGLQYFLTQDKDTHELGEVVHFELTFVNDTASDMIVPEARWDLNHRPQWNGVPWEQNILVPHNGSTTISKDISTADPLMHWNYRFWAHIKLPNGGETAISTWGKVETKRSIKPLSLVSDHRSYYTWDTIWLDAVLMNDGEVGNTADVVARITDSNESVVFEEQRKTDIILGGTAHEIFTAQLNLAPGTYKAQVRTLIHGLVQGSRECIFSVASDVRVSLVLPSTLEPNAVNTIGVKTKNSTGAIIPDSEGTVMLDLTSGQETMWSGEVALPGLEPGESVIKWFDVMIPRVVFEGREDMLHIGRPFWGYCVGTYCFSRGFIFLCKIT